MNSLETELIKLSNIKVIDTQLDSDNFIHLDLSTLSAGLAKFDLTNARAFESYIDNYLAANEAHIAYGGYIETRNLYKRSTVFNDSHKEERNIHIGIDLWIKAGTPVLAALDGKVHSFKYNAGLGDYGPTIILQHQLKNHTFYTLYGHLSLESLAKLRVGDRVEKGEKIGTLGTAIVNGDYAPHLHFQIIKDLGDFVGDYPGVCSLTDVEFYKANCPDPNLLLKIN